MTGVTQLKLVDLQHNPYTQGLEHNMKERAQDWKSQRTSKALGDCVF